MVAGNAGRRGGGSRLLAGCTEVQDPRRWRLARGSAYGAVPVVEQPNPSQPNLREAQERREHALEDLIRSFGFRAAYRVH